MARSITSPPRLHPCQIEEFLSGLPGRRSLGKRAYSAYFIATFRDQIERYLDEHVRQHYSAGRVLWVRRARKLMGELATPPVGYAYNPAKPALESTRVTRPVRSFHFSRDTRSSLTFAGAQRAARIAGYGLTVLLIAFVLWAGFSVGRSAVRYAAGWNAMLSEATAAE